MGEAKPCKQRPNIGSRVTREGHARFWERRRRNSSGRLDKLRRNAVAPPLPVNPQQRKFLAGDRHSRSVPRTDISGAFPKASHYLTSARRTRLTSPGQRPATDLQSLARSNPWALEVPLLRRLRELPLRGKLPVAAVDWSSFTARVSHSNISATLPTASKRPILSFIVRHVPEERHARVSDQSSNQRLTDQKAAGADSSAPDR